LDSHAAAGRRQRGQPSGNDRGRPGQRLLAREPHASSKASGWPRRTRASGLDL